MSGVDDDIDDEEYHEALLGHRDARNLRRKAEDVQDQLVTVHRVHKLVSCVVRLIIGHVTVHRWMMVLSSQRSEIRGAYAYGAWTCSTLDYLRGE